MELQLPSVKDKGRSHSAYGAYYSSTQMETRACDDRHIDEERQDRDVAGVDLNMEHVEEQVLDACLVVVNELAIGGGELGWDS